MRRIVYSSPYVPAEWIAAHGLKPYRLVPRGKNMDTPVKSIAGVCPFMRAFVNEACAERDTIGIVLSTACDQMRRAKDHIEAFSHVPVFLLNLPSTWKTSVSQRLYWAELNRLGAFLVEQGGKTPSRIELCHAMIMGEQQRCVRRRLKFERRTGIPVALLGGPLIFKDLEILNTLARGGGRVVLDGTENGKRIFPALFNNRHMHQDPLGELAEAYFRNIPDVFQRPNTRLYEWLLQEVPTRGARGVILLRYLWCDKWHAEAPRLKDALKVPLLDLELDGSGATKRSQTRIQAFLEGLS